MFFILPKNTHFIGLHAWEIHVFAFIDKKFLLVTNDEIGYFPVGV